MTTIIGLMHRFHLPLITIQTQAATCLSGVSMVLSRKKPTTQLSMRRASKSNLRLIAEEKDKLLINHLLPLTTSD